MLKLEPSEADRILVPSARLLGEQRKTSSALTKLVQQGLAEGGSRMEEAIRAVDAVILRRAGVGREDAEQLARARADAVHRRRSRTRNRRGLLSGHTHAAIDP